MTVDEWFPVAADDPATTDDAAPDPIADEWFPVATATEVTPGTVHPFQLLDERYVLLAANDANDASVTVVRDTCPHRGAQLSLGRFDGDRLECAYHGWQFDTSGRCRHQPAHPDATPSEASNLRPVRVSRAYDLYWVCLGDEPRNLPYYPAFHLHPGRTTICAPKRVRTSGPRIVENFLDMAHFPFVHGGYLGTAPHTEVRDHEIASVDGELRAINCTFWQPQPGPGAGQGGDVEYTYGVSHPYAARLVKIPSEADGGAAEAFEILLAVSPESELSCRAWMLTTAHSPSADLDSFNEFGALIFGQDVAVVESQRPARLPLDPRAEQHQRADRTSLAYRRWLVARGIRYGTSRNEPERGGTGPTGSARKP